MRLQPANKDNPGTRWRWLGNVGMGDPTPRRMRAVQRPLHHYLVPINMIGRAPRVQRASAHLNTRNYAVAQRDGELNGARLGR